MASITFLLSTLLLASYIILVSCNPAYDEDDYTDDFEGYGDLMLDYYDIITIKPEGGYIESEGYPNQYPKSVNYTWTLVAPPDGSIRILITDLRLELNENCSYDFLALYDGGHVESKKLAQLCYQHDQLVYGSTGNKMTIEFITDAQYEEPGFHLEFMIEMGDHCNTTLRAKEGTITSPNYPDNYPDNTDCWTIIKPEKSDEQVLINFNVVKFEYGQNCDYDFVEIYDGVSKSAKSLGRFCDTPTNSVILSTSGAILIHFHSDHLVNNVGYSIMYSIISAYKQTKNPDANDECLWNMNDLSGTIASPHYPNRYEPNEECLFLLEAPLNQKVSLTMGKIIMDGHDNCNLDYVEVRDGHLIDSPLLAKFCGRPFDPFQTVTSTTNKMWVRFVSNSDEEYLGFIAKYKVVNKAPAVSACKFCHEEKFVEPLVVTTRPNNVTLSKGQKHTFNCISNDLTIQPSWMKNFISINFGEQSVFPKLTVLTNHSLVIESMSWILEGIYTCTIVSSNEVQVYNAWVTYAPTAEERNCNIKFNVVPQSINTVEGSYTFLRCSTVNLHTQIKWMKDNKILTENTDPRIRIIFPGLVLIHPLLPHDTGNYRCVAQRLGGCSVSVTATIGVKQKPEIGCGVAAFKTIRQKPHESKGKIVGGGISVEGANPWQAMLYHSKEGPFCGGSVINVEWVVTAAHCLKLFNKMLLTSHGLQLEDLSIKLGKHKSSIRKEPNEQVVKVKEVYYHPHYTGTTNYDNDIALLHLEHPVDFNDYVSPICIGEHDFLEANVYSKQVYGWVTGWGKVKSGGRKSDELKEVSLPVVDPDTCNKSVTYKYEFTNNMFCAGFAQELLGDSCQGDSGGPFAVEIGDRWYLAGVVSWGEGCAAKGKYGFYTKVGNYYSWILDTIQKQSLT